MHLMNKENLNEMTNMEKMVIIEEDKQINYDKAITNKTIYNQSQNEMVYIDEDKEHKGGKANMDEIIDKIESHPLSFHFPNLTDNKYFNKGSEKIKYN